MPEQKELSALAELKGEYEELVESEQFGIVVSIISSCRADFYTVYLVILLVYTQTHSDRPSWTLHLFFLRLVWPGSQDQDFFCILLFWSIKHSQVAIRVDSSAFKWQRLLLKVLLTWEKRSSIIFDEHPALRNWMWLFDISCQCYLMIKSDPEAMNPACFKVFEKQASVANRPGDVSQCSYQFTMSVQKFDPLRLHSK